MKLFKVTINNFDIYLSRRDMRQASWFKADVQALWGEMEYRMLNGMALYTYMSLIARAVKAKSETFEIELVSFSRFAKIAEHVVLDSIVTLTQSGLIRSDLDSKGTHDTEHSDSKGADDHAHSASKGTQICALNPSDTLKVTGMPALERKKEREKDRENVGNSKGADLELRAQDEAKGTSKGAKSAREKPKGAIPEFGTTPELVEALIQVTQKTQKGWLALYQDVEFIKTEILKAQIWVSANPHKEPKSRWGKFYSSWLDRGWEKYRKTLPTNTATTSDKIDLNDGTWIF